MAAGIETEREAQDSDESDPVSVLGTLGQRNPRTVGEEKKN